MHSGFPFAARKGHRIIMTATVLILPFRSFTRSLTKSGTRWMASLLLLGSVVAGHAAEKLDSVFTAPPFKVNETVVGTQGWQLRFGPDFPIYNDPAEASVIRTSLVGSKQPTTLHLRTALRNHQIANLSRPYTIETQFSVTFNPRYYFGGGLYYSFALMPAKSPFHFGFDYGKEEGDGGIYYQGSGAKVIVLPRSLIAEGTPYKILIRVNPEASTFRVLVSGRDRLGEALKYESGDVKFSDEYEWTAAIPTFYLGNDKPSVLDTYIDYVKITPQ